MNKSGRRVTSSILTMLMLIVAACGDDGPKVLSADDLVTKVNGICRTADRGLGDLDATDDHYYDDASDTLADALDSLGKLKPAKEAKPDFDDLVANLGDQQDELTDLSAAVDDDDSGALSKAADKLVALQEASDELTDSIGSRSCFGADSIVVESGLTQDELVDEMNRICSAAKAKLDALEVNVADISSFWNDAADIFTSARNDLAALEPPSSLTKDYAELLDAVDTLIAELKDLGERGGFEVDGFEEAAGLIRAQASAIGSDACSTVAGMGDTGLES